MRGRACLPFVYLQFLLTGFLWAQSDRGSITGTVTDPSGGVVPEVQVTATNVDTHVRTTATTNEAGIYSILNLPIGSYSVSFTKQGFKTYDRAGIRLLIGQVAQVDAVLAVGVVTESVTVTADASILPTRNTELGTHLPLRIVNDLPLAIGRELESFAYKITPAVEGNSWTSYIGGSAAFSKEIMIDGTSTVVQYGGTSGTAPSMEAVEEFKVETSGFRAEDARTGGGVFKFTLKSGSNKLHGSAFGFMKNEIFDANEWNSNFYRAYNTAIDPANKAVYEEQYRKAFNRRFDYGFSAGGPIRKDRTFLFGALEHNRQEEWALDGFYRTVPTPAFLDGDFSALLDTSSAPLGTDAGGNSIYPGAIIDPLTGLVFPNNTIPANRISAPAKVITDIYRQSYKPTIPGALVNNSTTVRNTTPKNDSTQLSFKVDHNFSERLRLASSYIYTENPRLWVWDGGIWDPNDPNKTGGPLAVSERQGASTNAFRFSPTVSLAPNILNTTTFTYSRFRNPGTGSTAGGGWPEKLGFGKVGIGTIPEIGFGDPVYARETVWTDPIGDGSSWRGVDNIYQLNDSLSWVKGRHTAKFGGELRIMQINSHAGEPALRFDFSQNQTGAPQQPYWWQVGFGFASFLLGEVNRATSRVPFSLYGRRKFYTLWVQDDFKVNRKLTLTMDLRWEATGPLTEKYGHWANFEYTKMNTALGIPGALEFAGNGSTSFMKNRDWKEFSPHLGVAYQLTPRSVLRASYGIFYSPLGLNFHSGVPYAFAPGYQGTNIVGPTADLSPAFNWNNGYPGNYIPGTLDPNYVPYGTVRIDPNGLKAGYIQQWNAGVEFELTRDTRLGVQYMGNKGSRLHSDQFERNQPNLAAVTRLLDPNNYHEWDWVWDEASAAAAGVPYPYPGFSNYAWMALAPYSQVSQTWGPLFVLGVPKGSSDYRSLQFTLTRRSSRGVSAEASYNLSRARGNADNAFEENWWNGGFQDVTQLGKEAQTLISIDTTHVFKGYVAWNLPFGRGRAFLGNAGKVLNSLVGGWTLSSVFGYRSGQPLGIYSSHWYYAMWSSIYANVNTSGDFTRKFNSDKFNPLDATAASNLYFDSSNITNPTYGEFGTGPRALSQLRNFGDAQENVGILKNFKFSEGTRLQFRMEFFNLFNRHYFYGPDMNPGSSSFGHIYTATGPARQGQFGARFEW